MFNNIKQMNLLEEEHKFPSTRYQGSKLKIIDWIWNSIKNLNFDTALDAFGGTGCVAYLLKRKSKKVTYNDILKFNWYIGLALIENNNVILSKRDIDFLISKNNGIEYPTVIYDTFKNIYYTDEENLWIDMVVANIDALENIYKKAIAFFALFQSCIIKRPFNLFHRKNLYIRTSNVKRNFGNKTTWDTPFELHFKKFVEEANNSIFTNNRKNRALNMDIFDIKEKFDLIYIDTPYISKKGVGVDYLDFYHFLEGLANYYKWSAMINHKTKNKKIIGESSPWTNKKIIYSFFDKLFNKFKESILVVSYRSDGIPTIDELKTLLNKYKPKITEKKIVNYKYVLSNNFTEETILIGE